MSAADAGTVLLSRYRYGGCCRVNAGRELVVRESGAGSTRPAPYCSACGRALMLVGRELAHDGAQLRP